MSDLVWTLHTVSGAVGRVPRHILAHPLLGEYLVEVAPHSKPYDPELWKPTTAADYKRSRAAEESEADVDEGDLNDDDSEHEG